MTFQAALKKPQTFGRLVAILVSNSILWFVMTIAATLRKIWISLQTACPLLLSIV
jgi:hypothetical protein